MHPSIHPPSSLFGIVFLLAVRRSLPQLLLATIAAGLATYMAQFWLAPSYVAEARLTIEGAPPRAAVEAHVRALKDPIRLFSVASELGLQNRAEFNGENRGPAFLAQLGLSNLHPFAGLQDADERMLAAVYEKFAAAPGDEQGTIAVRLLSTDPRVAARFVNRLVELYLAGLWPEEVDGSSARAGKVNVAAWAEPPQKPVFPRKGPIAMLGMAITLLVGLGAIATREAFSTAAKHRHARLQEAAGPTRAGAAPFGRLTSPAAAADRVLFLPTTEHGCRIMVAGEAPGINATAEALGLAENLSHAGRRVVVVRWSLAGGTITGGRTVPGLVGINDLIEGRATFEEIISRLPGSRAHAIAAGSPVADSRAVLDLDRLGLVLDTPDEVYDFIVLVSEHEEARTLFATIEGRFDACLSVGAADHTPGALAAEVDRFLGFEVTDIHVMRLVRKRPAAPVDAPESALQARIA